MYNTRKENAMKRLFIIAIILLSFARVPEWKQPEFRQLVEEIRSYNATVYFRDPTPAIKIAQHKGEYGELYAKLEKHADGDMIRLLKETLWTLEGIKYLDTWDRLWKFYPMDVQTKNY